MRPHIVQGHKGVSKALPRNQKARDPPSPCHRIGWPVSEVRSELCKYDKEYEEIIEDFDHVYLKSENGTAKCSLMGRYEKMRFQKSYGNEI